MGPGHCISCPCAPCWTQLCTPRLRLCGTGGLHLCGVQVRSAPLWGAGGVCTSVGCRESPGGLHSCLWHRRVPKLSCRIGRCGWLAASSACLCAARVLCVSQGPDLRERNIQFWLKSMSLEEYPMKLGRWKSMHKMALDAVSPGAGVCPCVHVHVCFYLCVYECVGVCLEPWRNVERTTHSSIGSSAGVQQGQEGSARVPCMPRNEGREGRSAMCATCALQVAGARARVGPVAAKSKAGKKVTAFLRKVRVPG